MRKRGKKFAAARAQVAVDRTYTIEDAIPLMQKVKFAKFDETVEMSLQLGVDPKHADQMVRGTVVLPHGLGKIQARPRHRRRREAEGSDRRPAPTWSAARSSWRRSRAASWTSTPSSRRPT